MAAKSVSKCLAALIISACAADIKLATFDGAKATTASWTDKNDPVMGGSSSSAFSVSAQKTGVFNGTCAIVGFLKAPGFAKVEGKREFADISIYDSISLRVRSSTPTYQGFKIAFAAPGIPKSSMFVPTGSYKAGFQLHGSAWQVVDIPLTEFSRDWSAYTGRCDTKDPSNIFSKGTQHYCCDKSGQKPSKPDVCVEDKFLKTISSVELWAEGVHGDFHLEVDWIGASNKKTANILV